MDMYKLGEEWLYYLEFEEQFKDIKNRRERFWRIAYFWENMPVQELGQMHISKLKENYIIRKLKPSYINMNLFIIRSFLRWCKDEKNLNVLEPTKIKLLKNPFKDVRYLNLNQIKTALSVIDTSRKYGVQCMAMILCLLSTGMRRSEIVSLNRNSISIDSNNRGTAFITGKGGKTRKVFFEPWAVEWVRLHLKNRTDKNEAIFVNFSSNVRDGRFERLKPDGLNHYCREISKKVGFSAAPHDWRRTAATFLRFNGCDLKDVQDFLGHKKIQTTESYLGVDYERLQNKIVTHINYGHGTFPVNVRVAWDRQGIWRTCQGCKSKERPHKAQGFCRMCYMRSRRIGRTVEKIA